MENIALTITLVRRTIQSTGVSANHKNTSQKEDALIFFSSLETQSILESMTTISRVGNPWGHHLNNPFSFFGGFSIPRRAFPMLPNYGP
jgi:hypothetical protein